MAERALCANCGTPLAGRWCHACGQDSRDPLRAVGVLLEEFLESALSWDSRLARTLHLLLTRPGGLTDEFVAGRRAPYLGPVRLYLLASVVYVAVYAAYGGEPTLVFLAGAGDILAGMSELSRIERWLSLMLLALMPLAAFVAAVTFRRPGIGLIEHSVWVLHMTSFTLLVWAIANPIGTLALGWFGVFGQFVVVTIANAAVFVYGWRAVQRHYRHEPLEAFLRACAYGVSSAIALRAMVLLVLRAVSA